MDGENWDEAVFRRDGRDCWVSDERPFAKLQKSAQQACKQATLPVWNSCRKGVAGHLTKNPLSEVVAHFLIPTGYLVQSWENGALATPPTPHLCCLCSGPRRKTCVCRQGSSGKSRLTQVVRNARVANDSSGRDPSFDEQKRMIGGCPIFAMEGGSVLGLERRRSRGHLAPASS